jgi:hypothetical protein
MFEKPTNATLRPSRSITRGRLADARLPPAPTASIPNRRTLRTVSSSAARPKSPAWLFARLSTSKPA